MIKTQHHPAPGREEPAPHAAVAEAARAADLPAEGAAPEAVYYIISYHIMIYIYIYIYIYIHI